MNKNFEDETRKKLDRMIGVSKEFAEILIQYSKFFDHIFKTINFLLRSYQVILFVVVFIFWRVFLWEPLNVFLNSVYTKWEMLAEAYKITILTILGSIPSGIITIIVGHFLLDKINRFLKR